MSHEEPRERLLRRARIALGIARQVEAAAARGDPADRKLTEVLRRHREYGSRDRRFYGDLVFSCLRWRGFTGTVAESGAAAAVWAAHLDHERTCGEIQALAADAGIALPAENPLAAGTLAERAARFSELAGRIVRPADVVPEWVPRLLAGPPDLAPEDLLARLLESLQTRPPMWFRVRGAGTGAFLSLLTAEGHAATGGPLPSSVCTGGRPHIDDLDRLAGPVFEVQDVASQAVGLLCDPRPGEDWWDACAGAGGKTLHLADLMRGEGRILATDLRPAMAEEMGRRLRRAGTKIVTAKAHDARRPLPGAPRFDGVLVDAPCSGIGTWSRSPDARWRETEDHVRHSAEAQGAILLSAADHVRPGGRLVYSVCTLTRSETVGAVEAFAAARPDFTLESPRWFLPWEGPGGAMFMARFVRRE